MGISKIQLSLRKKGRDAPTLSTSLYGEKRPYNQTQTLQSLSG